MIGTASAPTVPNRLILRMPTTQVTTAVIRTGAITTAMTVASATSRTILALRTAIGATLIASVLISLVHLVALPHPLRSQTFNLAAMATETKAAWITTG